MVYLLEILLMEPEMITFYHAWLKSMSSLGSYSMILMGLGTKKFFKILILTYIYLRQALNMSVYHLSINQFMSYFLFYTLYEML